MDERALPAFAELEPGETVHQLRQLGALDGDLAAELLRARRRVEPHMIEAQRQLGQLRTERGRVALADRVEHGAPELELLIVGVRRRGERRDAHGDDPRPPHSSIVDDLRP